MISRKFGYADDLALLHSSGNWKDLEGTSSQDMSTLSAYLQTWRLMLSHTKIVAAAFHLNSKKADTLEDLERKLQGKSPNDQSLLYARQKTSTNLLVRFWK